MKSTDNGFKMISGRAFLRAEDGEVIEFDNITDVQIYDFEPPLEPVIKPYKPPLWIGAEEIKLTAKNSAAMNKAVYGLILDLFFNDRKDYRGMYHILTHSKKRRIRKKALKRLRNMLWRGEA